MKNPHKRSILQFRLSSFLILALVFLPRPAYAPPPMNRYVGVGGTDSGLCVTAFPPCATVAYAISQSNSGDTIMIGAGTFHSTVLDVTRSLNFQGQGMNTTILDADSAGSVFSLAPGLTTTIQNLTITGGAAGADVPGGGIYQLTGTLTVTGVRVTGNTAGWGGGIYSSGALSITGSEVSSNQAIDNNGGGIYMEGTTLSATLLNVTLADNTAVNNGGGIHDQVNNVMAGGMTLTNVTLNNNTAKAAGGLDVTNGAYVTITNTTIAGNHIHNVSGANTGGISNFAFVHIKNSIIAGNDDWNCNIGPAASWTSDGNNIADDAHCDFSDISHHDRQNTDPRLGNLANNGGPIQTMALLLGSPAIDGVTYNAPNGCPPTDARGIARPIGSFCDIGAYEYNMTNYNYLPLIAR